MSRSVVLARGRAAAEAGMIDTCQISRPGAEVTDPFSGEVTTGTTEIYTGKCRVQQTTAQAQQQDAGEAFVLLQNVEIQLPVAVTGLEVGDQVVLTISRDEDLVGRIFRIRDLAYKTDATARRMRVQEITS